MAATMQLIAPPAAPARRGRAVARKATKVAKRVGSFARAKAAEEKHTLTAIGSCLVLGYAESKGIAVPKIGPLSSAGTIGLAAWLVGKMSKNRTIEHVATGLLSVQAYEFGRGAAGSMSGDLYGDDMITGEV